MAERVAYWICRCGKANYRSDRRCQSCGKRRPFGWLFYVVIIILGMVLVAGLMPENGVPAGNGAGQAPPQSQERFETEIRLAGNDWRAAANRLARSSRLDSRDIAIIEKATIGGRIDDWQGEIIDIAPMGTGIGVSVGVGPAQLIAGHYRGLGLDTLASKDDDFYPALQSLEPGERVVFSGEFAIMDGAAVEMSYSDRTAASRPSFLFTFDTIAPVAGTPSDR